MRQLAGEMTEVEADFAGGEAKALEKFELRFRQFIDSKLREEDNNYWAKTGTPDFRGRIEERIDDWLKANPGRNRDNVTEVDFCQILEYLAIIKAHWNTFEQSVRSRSDLEMHLRNVSNFRNLLMHSREIDVATRQLALGSLSWFDEILKASGSTD
jgi:hypothetical protein